MTTLNVVVEYVPAELEQPDHLSHIFTGWADFLRHVRESHRIVPLEDDGETWILHDALHVGERAPDTLLVVMEPEIGTVGEQNP